MASGDLAVEKELARHLPLTMEEWWGQRVAAMASEDREVEEELARREYRTELKCKSRTDLQSLAKDYGIPANLKSNVLIDGMLHWEYDDMGLDEILMCAETMEVVRSLMKKINVRKQSTENAAKWIVDCVMKVEAEMNAPAAQVFNPVPSGKVAIPSVSSCATAVKAVPVIGVAAKPDTNKHGIKFEPAVVKAVQQVIGVKPVVPAVVESKRGEAGFTSIFFRVSKTVTDDQLRTVVGINAKIGRRRRNRSGRIFVPDDDVGRVLKLESVSGHKLRVEKWRSSKAPSYHTNRHGRQAIKEDVTTTMKERARFAAEFLAQTRPERSYSQVVSNKVEDRMKSMETAMYDVKQLLKRMSSREASTRATAIPRFHGGERV